MDKEIPVTNLYEMNKAMVEQTDHPMSKEELALAASKVLEPYYNEHKDEEYFMLLCHEKRDYTVFFNSGNRLSRFQEEVTSILTERGSVYSIESISNNEALEIWVKYKDKEMVCFYLFPYTKGVIVL